MSLNIHKASLPQSDLKEIKLEFLVLHYTAASLRDTLCLFQDPQNPVSTHLVINLDGTVFELLNCMDGTCLEAWHAGDSHWTEQGKHYKNFNHFSIGIELVNKNGNLFAYTKEQYQSLKEVMNILKKHYPALKSPHRVVGHEHIASHRGKVDPGYEFNWPLFFKMSYPGQPAPIREPILNQEQRQFFRNKAEALIKKSAQNSKDWMNLNIEMEKRARRSLSSQ